MAGLIGLRLTSKITLKMQQVTKVDIFQVGFKCYKATRKIPLMCLLIKKQQTRYD